MTKSGVPQVVGAACTGSWQSRQDVAGRHSLPRVHVLVDSLQGGGSTRVCATLDAREGHAEAGEERRGGADGEVG